MRAGKAQKSSPWTNLPEADWTGGGRKRRDSYPCWPLSPKAVVDNCAAGLVSMETAVYSPARHGCVTRPDAVVKLRLETGYSGRGRAGFVQQSAVCGATGAGEAMI